MTDIMSETLDELVSRSLLLTPRDRKRLMKKITSLSFEEIRLAIEFFSREKDLWEQQVKKYGVDDFIRRLDSALDEHRKQFITNVDQYFNQFISK